MTVNRYILPLALTALLASCGVRRPAEQSPSATSSIETPSTALTAATILDRAPAYAPVLRGAAQADIRLGKEALSTKVNATIVRGQGMYWSIVPFPLIEAARVWFTSEGITAVDRIHGRYAEVSYQELSQLLGLPLSYTDVEYLFLAHPFTVDKNPKARSAVRLDTPTAGAELTLTEILQLRRGGQRSTYQGQWSLDRSTQEARSFAATEQLPQPKRLFTLRYAHTSASQALHLPQTTDLYLGSGQRLQPDLSIDWSRLRPYEGKLPEMKPQIKASYERITLESLLALISKM